MKCQRNETVSQHVHPSVSAFRWLKPAKTTSNLNSRFCFNDVHFGPPLSSGIISHVAMPRTLQNNPPDTRCESRGSPPSVQNEKGEKKYTSTATEKGASEGTDKIKVLWICQDFQSRLLMQCSFITNGKGNGPARELYLKFQSADFYSFIILPK